MSNVEQSKAPASTSDHLPARLRSRIAAFLAEMRSWGDARALPALAIWGGMLCVTAMVVLRVLAGAAPIRLSNWQLCLTASAVAILNVVARAVMARVEPRPVSLGARILLGAAALAPVMALLWGTESRHSKFAVGFSTALAVASAAAVFNWRGRARVGSESSNAAAMEPTEKAQATVALRTASAAGDAAPFGPTGPLRVESTGDRPSQWLKRIVDAAGREVVEGVALAEFAAGQSFAVVHVPFVPPFGRMPLFTSELVECPDVRLKGSAVFAYGARLELKRSGDVAVPLVAEIRFRAIAERTLRAA
jgi:hypothetical protein